MRSPNEFCVDSSGAIDFSDRGTGGCPASATAAAPARLPGRLPDAPGGGEPELIVGRDEYEMPNGTALAGRVVFDINDTPGAYIKVYDAAPDGSISNGRMFFEGIGSGVIEEGIRTG